MTTNIQINMLKKKGVCLFVSMFICCIYMLLHAKVGKKNRKPVIFHISAIVNKSNERTNINNALVCSSIISNFPILAAALSPKPICSC